MSLNLILGIFPFLVSSSTVGIELQVYQWYMSAAKCHILQGFEVGEVSNSSTDSGGNLRANGGVVSFAVLDQVMHIAQFGGGAMEDVIRAFSFNKPEVNVEEDALFLETILKNMQSSSVV
ncbi:hypothetical protein AMTRI_Chr05g59230 [Amborella trichopoda]